MKSILILVAVLVVAAPTAKANGRDFSGKQLYSDCKALLVVFHGTATPGQVMDGGWCGGYLHGFNAGFGSGTPNGTDIYCDPADLSLDTQAKIYIAFMDKHPELFAKSDGVGVFLAMREAFPCKR